MCSGSVRGEGDMLKSVFLRLNIIVISPAAPQLCLCSANVPKPCNQSEIVGFKTTGVRTFKSLCGTFIIFILNLPRE